MPTAEITVTQTMVATTRVECGFTLAIVLSTAEDGSDWWEIHGWSGDRGAEALNEIEQWVHRELRDHTTVTRGDYRDWWAQGSGGDLDALVAFAAEICAGDVAEVPGGLTLHLKGAKRSEKAKIPLVWYDKADQFGLGEGQEPAWLAAYSDGFYELLQMFMYEDGMCEGEYEGENEKIVTWKLVATTPEAKEHLAEEVCP